VAYIEDEFGELHAKPRSPARPAPAKTAGTPTWLVVGYWIVGALVLAVALKTGGVFSKAEQLAKQPRAASAPAATHGSGAKR
jgi:hypothetical protein